MDFNPSSLALRANACDTLLQAHSVQLTGVKPVTVSFRGSCYSISFNCNI